MKEPESLIKMLAMVFALFLILMPIAGRIGKKQRNNYKLAYKNFDVLFSKLQEITRCKKVGKCISGESDGFSFEFYILSFKRAPFAISIKLFDNFPKQKIFMLDYPAYENGISWRGKYLYREQTDFSNVEEMLATLHSMKKIAYEIKNS